MGLFLVVTTGPPARAWASLTHYDFAVLATQPPTQLLIRPSLLHRLNLLAAGRDREVVLCLQGAVSGDTVAVDDFVMPDLVTSGADAVRPLPCGSATIASWHNHPGSGSDSVFGIRPPADFCSLSEPNIRTVVTDSIPFAGVTVGRTKGPVVCWWRRDQVAMNKRVRCLPRFPGQWRVLSP